MIRRMMFAAAAVLPAAFLPKAVTAKRATIPVVESDNNFYAGPAKLYGPDGIEIKIHRVTSREITNASNKSVNITIIGTEFGDVDFDIPPMCTYKNERYAGEPDPELEFRVNTSGAMVVMVELLRTGRLWSTIRVGPDWNA